jgi:hypothetical protein
MVRWPAVGGGPRQLTSGRDSGGAGHAELTGGAVGRSSMGAGLVVVVDDRARQRLVTARGDGRLGSMVVRSQGPEEVVA